MACGNKEKLTDRKRYFILIDIRTHYTQEFEFVEEEVDKKGAQNRNKMFLRKTTKLTGAQFQVQIQDPDSTHT